MQRFFIAFVCLLTSTTAAFAGTIDVEMKLRIDSYELLGFRMVPVDLNDTDPAKYYSASSVSLDDPNIAILGYDGDLIGGGIGDEIIFSFSSPLGLYSWTEYPPPPSSVRCQLGTYDCDRYIGDFGFDVRTAAFMYSPNDILWMAGAFEVGGNVAVRFSDRGPTGIFSNDLVTADWEDGAAINATVLSVNHLTVPVPAALGLLGSGLIGLLAFGRIRRKLS